MVEINMTYVAHVKLLHLKQMLFQDINKGLISKIVNEFFKKAWDCCLNEANVQDPCFSVLPSTQGLSGKNVLICIHEMTDALAKQPSPGA